VKVKQLMKLLKKCDPEHEVQIVVRNDDDEDVSESVDYTLVTEENSVLLLTSDQQDSM